MVDSVEAFGTVVSGFDLSVDDPSEVDPVVASVEYGCI